MRLLEYRGKQLFARIGIPVPRGRVATEPAQAEAIARELGVPVMVKAQVLAPSRGARGGILPADDAAAAAQAAAQLLGRSLGEEVCREVLVEERLEIAQELYAAVTIDPIRHDILFLLSARGGAEIEKIFAEFPQDVIRHNHSPLEPFFPFHGRQLARAAGLTGGAVGGVGQILFQLYQAFREFQAKLVEINPLVITAKGQVVAADAIVQLDEDAAFRVRALKELGIPMEEERPRAPTARELEAIEIDKKDYRGVVHYQDLDAAGDIGVVSVGSGFSLTLLDILDRYGLHPANFCDCSGSPPASKVYQAVKLVLSIPGIRGFLFMSGVVTQDLTVTAQGIVQAFQELRPQIPFVVRLAGNRDREAYELLQAGGITHAFPRKALVETCVEKLRTLMREQERKQQAAS